MKPSQMKPSRKTAIALTALGVILAGATFAAAQDEHKGHHPDATAPKAEPKADAVPAPKAETAPAPKAGTPGMGMGMMSPDHMKQMGEMCGKMMGGGDMAAMGAKGDTGPASQAYAAANAKMHQGMAITFTGDADVDFTKGMIAHHQGAIEMAKIVLQYGKDPKTRKLAEDIIKAQEAEIAMMSEWLKTRAQ